MVFKPGQNHWQLYSIHLSEYDNYFSFQQQINHSILLSFHKGESTTLPFVGHCAVCCFGFGSWCCCMCMIYRDRWIKVVDHWYHKQAFPTKTSKKHSTLLSFFSSSPCRPSSSAPPHSFCPSSLFLIYQLPPAFVTWPPPHPTLLVIPPLHRPIALLFAPPLSLAGNKSPEETQ